MTYVKIDFFDVEKSKHLLKVTQCEVGFREATRVSEGTNYKPMVKLIPRCLGGLRPPKVFPLLGDCPLSTYLLWETKSP